jgi:hypothetical protein
MSISLPKLCSDPDLGRGSIQTSARLSPTEHRDIDPSTSWADSPAQRRGCACWSAPRRLMCRTTWHDSVDLPLAYRVLKLCPRWWTWPNILPSPRRTDSAVQLVSTDRSGKTERYPSALGSLMLWARRGQTQGAQAGSLEAGGW